MRLPAPPRITPVTPDDVKSGSHIPEQVIAAFNECIRNNFNGSSSIVRNSEVILKICSNFKREPTEFKDEIYHKGWLNIESIFEKAGWVVEYDKPGYNESYEAYFKFSIKE